MTVHRVTDADAEECSDDIKHSTTEPGSQSGFVCVIVAILNQNQNHAMAHPPKLWLIQGSCFAYISSQGAHVWGKIQLGRNWGNGAMVPVPAINQVVQPVFIAW